MSFPEACLALSPCRYVAYRKSTCLTLFTYLFMLRCESDVASEHPVTINWYFPGRHSVQETPPPPLLVSDLTAIS